jgi:hypothetical protein
MTSSLTSVISKKEVAKMFLLSSVRRRPHCLVVVHDPFILVDQIVACFQLIINRVADKRQRPLSFGVIGFTSWPLLLVHALRNPRLDAGVTSESRSILDFHRLLLRASDDDDEIVATSSHQPPILWVVGHIFLSWAVACPVQLNITSTERHSNRRMTARTNVVTCESL